MKISTETKKVSEDLKIGDTIMWCNIPKIIREFKEYHGLYDFILKIAVFTDGTAMSLEKGHMYKVAKIKQTS